MIIIELIHNLSILIALSIISGFLDRRYPRTTLTGRILQGILFGIVAIVGMLQPLIFNAGLIFDGRSIVISLSALFFGPISGSIAGLMAIIFRIIQNGFGIVPGTLVIISSVVIGSIFHFQWKKRNNEIRVRQLLYLGVSVHFVMLLMMFSLPYSIAITVIQKIGIAVILLYPLATVLIGKILSDQEINFRVIENIKANELKFRMVADLTYGWEYWENENQKLIYISPSCKRITGYTQDEFYSNPSLLEKIVYHEDSENYIKHSTKVYSIEHKDVADNLEFRIVKKDDSIVNIYHICRPVFDSNHKFLGRRISNRDITEHKKAEEALHMSEQLFHALAQVSPVGIFRTDINGYTTYVNPRWSQLSGLSFEDSLGNGWLNAVHPDDKEKLNQGWHGSTRDNKESYSEYRFLRPDGTIAWVIGQAIPEMNSENQIIGYIGAITDITERKRTENALNDSRENLYLLLNSIEEGAYGVDTNGNCTFVNRAFLQILGYQNEDELIGKHIHELIHHSHQDGSPYPSHECRMYRVHITCKATNISDEVFWRKDGVPIPIEYWVHPIVKEGKVIGSIATFINITERKQNEEALRKSEDQYRTLFENLPIGIGIADLTGKIITFNDAMLKPGGFSRVDIMEIGNVENFYYSLSERLKVITLLKEKGSVNQYPVKFKRKDGSYYDALLTLSLINFHGEIRTQVLVEDITERKKAEQKVRESEKRFKAIFDQAPISIALLDFQGYPIISNLPLSKMVGYSSDELAKMKFTDFTYPEDVNKDWTKFVELIEGKISQYGMEKRFVHKNGNLIWVNLIVRMMRDESGIPKEIIGMAEDITKRKHNEEEILMLAQSLKSVNECVSITDMEDNILFVNESFWETYGYNENELIGKNITIIRSHNNPTDLVREILPATIRGGWQGELWNKRKDGSEFLINLSTTMIKDKEGKSIGLIGVAKDITEFKRNEIELIKAKERAEQSDQLKSEFINQISHEIRSPMNAVLSFTNLLKEEMLEKLTPDLLEYLEGIDSAGHRLMRTVDLILNFSEMQVGTYKPFFTRFDLLKEIIEKIINENKRAVEEKGLILNFLSTPSEAVIEGDQYSIHQIFANLIDNSIKYTKEGYISINVSKDDRGIIVKIEDTGIGMSEEFMERMYHPFTQEERGYSRSYDGSGLGLSLVKKYCDLNNIDITVESMKDVGTKFTLFFAKTE